MKNGDKIRNMTNQELAEMIVFENMCFMCAVKECHHAFQSADKCCQNIVKWLEMEVNNNEK